jgi:predicted pyridoxine 5'-phosphate oxidase superfamily flavin-nucleotide-binding protein
MTPFHSGELAVQQRAGETAYAQRNSAIVTPVVVGAARGFLKHQNMVVLASRGEQQEMWASLVFGRPGFVGADGGKVFDVDLNQALADPRDPLWSNLDREGRLGSLIIDLSSRRRIRINGPAHIDADGHLRIDVEEAFPACPKYITRRQTNLAGALPLAGDGADLVSGSELTDRVLATVNSADALFIATQSAGPRYDVSHRGGAAGFVKVTGPRTLRWPEFQGNSMFMTLGNLELEPRSGVVIPDFARNRVVQMTGTAKSLWGQPDPHNESGGTRRFLEFTVERWQELPLPANLKTEFLDYSPFNPETIG